MALQDPTRENETSHYSFWPFDQLKRHRVALPSQAHQTFVDSPNSQLKTVKTRMATSSVLLPISLCCPLRPNCLFSNTHLRQLNRSSNSSPDIHKSARIGDKIVAFVRDPNESQFLDENGVIDDMDSYLNYLSLEYDSVWDTKPSWCQPWTITLTGALAIAFSWLVLQSVAVTTVVSLLICAWWYIFLYSYPKAYADMIAERRKRVTNGDEDTYGTLRKTQ